MTDAVALASAQGKKATRIGLYGLTLWFFLLLVGLLEYGLAQLARQHGQENQERQFEAANAIRILLESEITTAASLATGIESYIVARRGEILAADIEPMLALIYERSRLFRNIGLAPGNRIEYLFPLEGNQAALGMRYEDNPKQWPSVQRAMKARKGVLDGPITLVQGGLGLIYRQPVFIGDVYWGMMSTVLDADELFSLLDPLRKDPGLSFAMRKTDADGQPGALFLGDASVFEQTPSLLNISLPGAVWQLAVQNAASTNGALWPVRVAGWLVIFVLMLLFRSWLRLQWQHTSMARLEVMVQKRTQQIESVNSLLQSVLNAASEIAIIATDTEGIITLFNSGAQGMLGYQASELVSLSTPEVLHRPDELERHARGLHEEYGVPLAGFHSLVQRAHEAGNEAREWTYVRRDGSELPVFVMVTVIRNANGEPAGYLFVAENIAERKRMERVKNEFISTVSHELRTPLTAISGALGLVVGGVFGELPGRSHELLAVAHKNSQRLHLLINDLLDMEKLVAGKMRFDMQIQPLQPLLERALKDNQSYAEQLEVRLELEPLGPDIEVNVDAHRLQQVMANLLSNAAKFSPSGAVVSVSVLRQPDGVRVQIRDRGPGIPVEFQARIFEKFAQADASDAREKSGTGLGLAITRELVQRMGGRVGFDSVVGQGTTFWFELPSEITSSEKGVHS